METEKKEYLVEKLTLTEFTRFMNSHYGKKKSGEIFKIADVQQYIATGNLPSYLGGNKIEIDNSIKGVKLYQILKK